MSQCTAKVSSVFVFLLRQFDMLIWKGGAGIIDTGAGCEMQSQYCVSVFVCRRRWLLSCNACNLCIRLTSKCRAHLAHIGCVLRLTDVVFFKSQSAAHKLQFVTLTY